MNNDDYKRGYTDGYNDAVSGKSRNYSRSGLSIKYALFGSSAIDSYNEGYSEGYRIGITSIASKMIIKLEILIQKRTPIIGVRHISTDNCEYLDLLLLC